jgi:1-acyl-sn-glycerol-3-phosphate acyltransferase
MRLGYRFCRFVCQWCGVLLFRVRVFGWHNVPKSGGALVMCNHQSFMDPVLAMIGPPREGHYMARDTLFRNKYFGWLISYVNAYPVRRGTADMAAIKETIRRLKEGNAVLAFPEGTRTPDGRVGPMLAGLATVGKKCNVPIVPAMVDGVFQAWPRHQLLPGWGDVVVEYGKPITPAEYAGMTADELTDEVRRRIIAMQHEWHRRVPSRRLEWYQEEL